MITRFDPLRAMRVLVANDVRFIVIGGLAGRALGSPTITNDLEIEILSALKEEREKLTPPA